MSDLEQLMTKADVCAYLRCSERTLTEIPKAMLPWARIGSERLYSPSAIAAYVAARSGVNDERPNLSRERRRATPRGSWSPWRPPDRTPLSVFGGLPPGAGPPRSPRLPAPIAPDLAVRRDTLPT